jgi:hypothetical protein
MDSAVVRPEENLANGVIKFLKILPELQTAITLVTDPIERNQFKWGLTHLESELTKLLDIKGRLISFLTNLRSNRTQASPPPDQLRSDMREVEKALDYLDPQHFDHVFGPQDGSPMDKRRQLLRSDFYSMRDLIRKGLAEKNDALIIINYATKPGALDIDLVLQKLQASKSELEKADLAVRTALDNQ